MLESIGSDGSLSPQEIIQQVLAKMQDSEKMSEGLISMKDKDGDGMLSFEELDTEKDTFTAADTDKDGFLNQSELAANIDATIDQKLQSFINNPAQAAAKAHGSFDASGIAANIIAKRDKDGDGMVSEAESRFKGNRFKKADADGDGLLTTDEISSYLDTMMESVRERMGANDDSYEDSSDNFTSLLDALNQNKNKDTEEETSSEDSTYEALDVLA